MYVSEPANFDNLAGEANWRYTQFEVFHTLLDDLYLNYFNSDKFPKIYIKPHPREDSLTWVKYIERFENEINILDVETVIVEEYDIVCGVNSILLYEAWLKGTPVLVPHKYIDFSHMRIRSGVLKCFEQLPDKNERVFGGAENDATYELDLHKNALDNTFKIILKNVELRKGY